MPDDDGPRAGSGRRWRAWWVVVVVAALLVTAAGLVGAYRSYQGSGPFHVGTCFELGPDTGVVGGSGLRQVTGRAKIVDCGSPHDARMTRKAGGAADCAAEGAWLESRSQVYCVALTG